MDDLASFSPDGRLFCTPPANDCLALVDLQTGRWRRLRIDPPDPDRYGEDANRSAWSPDGRFLAVRTTSRVVTLYNTATGQRAGRLSLAGWPARWGMAFSPDGRNLALDRGTRIELRHLSALAQEVWLNTGHQSICMRGDEFPNLFYRDRNHLLIVEAKGFVRVFDSRSGKELDRREGHRATVTGLAFSSDGRTLVSLDGDGGLCRWDMHRCRLRDCFAVSGVWAADSLSVSGDGRLAVFQSGGVFKLEGESPNQVSLIELNRRRVLWQRPGMRMLERRGRSPSGDSFWPPPCLMSSDGRVAGVLRAAMGFEHVHFHVEIRQTATGLQRKTIEAGPRKVHGLSPDGRLLIVSSESGNKARIDLVDWREGRIARQFTIAQARPPGLFQIVAFSHNGRLLSAATMGRAYLWELASGQLLEDAPVPEDLAPTQLVITPAGQVFVAGWRTSSESDIHNRIAVWAMQARQVSRTTPATSWMAGVALAPDGRTLALGQEDSSILLFDVPLPGARRGASASMERLSRCWVDLASADARRAWRARQRLTTSGASAVNLLARHLTPTMRRIPAQLLADLDASAYVVRCAAESKLAALLKDGDRTAELTLRELLESNPPVEVYRRAERLLRRHVAWPVKYSPGELRQIRAVAVLEQIAGAEAQTLLRKLSRSEPSLLTAEARAALARLGKR